MTLRFFEITEANHRILNPFTDQKLMLLAEICKLQPGRHQLDLACGKGEMLCRWTKDYGITGTGVDISPVFLEAARQRATELGVASQVAFVQDDAAMFTPEPHAYDIVSCIGATWIGGGTAGTIELMKKALKEEPESLLLVGDVFWKDAPSDEALEALGINQGDWAVGLDGMLERFEQAGTFLLEMVLASPGDWDRYEAKHWMTFDRWIRANPDDPDADELLQWILDMRLDYLRVMRPYCGWGVFVLRSEGQ
jgi:SAM-dependent methyltransferase